MSWEVTQFDVEVQRQSEWGWLWHPIGSLTMASHHGTRSLVELGFPSWDCEFGFFL